MKPNLFGFLVFHLLLAFGAESAPLSCAIDNLGSKSPAWIAGTVRSYNEAIVSAEVFGMVEHVVEPGAIVKFGDEIGHVEQEIYRIAIGESSLRIKFLEEKISHLERKLVATSALLDTSAISELSVDDIRINLAAARSEHELEKLALKMHDFRLRKSVLRAPFSGVIVERIARIGELLEIGDPIARIVDISNLYIEAYVPAGDSKLLLDTGVAIIESPEGILCGTVDRVIPVALSASNVQVWVKVEGLKIAVGGKVRVSFGGK